MRAPFSLLLLLSSYFAEAQTGSCAELHNGTFYYYPKHIAGVYIREGSIQKETFFDGDTTFWRVDWPSDCNYTLTYLYRKTKGRKTMRKLDFPINVTILEKTDSYYRYEAVANNKGKEKITKDTLWFGPNEEKKKRGELAQPEFPGGDSAWAKYVQNGLQNYERALGRPKPKDLCMIAFCVEADGSVSKAKALTMIHSKLAKAAIDVITSSPKWRPAIVDGKPTAVWRVQPVRLASTMEQEEKDVND